MDLTGKFLERVPPREREIVEKYLDPIRDGLEGIQQQRSNLRYDTEMREIQYECAMDMYSFVTQGKWHTDTEHYNRSNVWSRRLF